MKKYLKMLLPILMAMVLVVPVFAEEHPKRVVDEADLLEHEEELILEKRLNEISVSNEFDLAVVTVNSLNGKDVQSFADDYYDEHGYGYGADLDGALLLISMEDRDWYITTSGWGIYSIDDELWYIEDEMVPYLSDGEYLEAFEQFASCCEEILSYNDVGSDYDDDVYDDYGYEDVPAYTHTKQRSLGKVLMTLGGCLLVGFLLAFLCMRAMVSQMKNVNFKVGATEYMKSREPNLTVCRDRFLYHNISKTPKPKENTNHSNHNSSVHMSSGGRSHGGGGGKF